jgi:hypothetical protein
VQAHEWKRRKVVIELDVAAPGLDAVALRAVRAEFAGVHVIRPMASGAFAAEPLARDDCRVASMAIELLVCPEQLELAVTGVIEVRWRPCAGGMARLTG